MEVSRQTKGTLHFVSGIQMSKVIAALVTDIRVPLQNNKIKVAN